MMTATLSVDEVDPVTAFAALQRETTTQLVDVRTHAEWSFVGLPDLSEIGKQTVLVEWVSFPSMAPNANFLTELEQRLGGSWPERLLFICRSGQRSMAAAHLVAKAVSETGRGITCTNVAEGFEGGFDVDGRRGKLEGWKARGCPWRQG